MIKALFGAGGFANEIKACMSEFSMPCFVDKEYWKPNRENILPLSEFDPAQYEMLISIADPLDREKIVKRLPRETKYWTFIHPSAQIFNPTGVIGEGSIIMANSVLTYQNRLGRHVHFNVQTFLAHNSVVGDFSTTAPGVMIMGDCRIGNRVYLGVMASVKQKVSICDDVTIGMGTVVLKDINEPGTYIGCPARRMK